MNQQRPSKITVRPGETTRPITVSNRTQRRWLLVSARLEDIKVEDGSGWLVCFASIEKRSDSFATLNKHADKLARSPYRGRGVIYLAFDTTTGTEVDWNGQPKFAEPTPPVVETSPAGEHRAVAPSTNLRKSGTLPLPQPLVIVTICDITGEFGLEATWVAENEAAAKASILDWHNRDLAADDEARATSFDDFADVYAIDITHVRRYSIAR